MNYKSKAISLIYIRQGNTSIISKILTKEKGLQSFIVKGVRSKKAKKKLSYFEPLKLLNIDAKYNAKKPLQYLGEITLLKRFDTVEKKIHRNFIAFFIAEVCSKVLQENEQNIEIFDFLWSTTIELYSQQMVEKNFPLIFLLNLSRYLGFYPSSIDIKKPFFELESGTFSEHKNPLKTYLNKEESHHFKSLIKGEKTKIPQQNKSAFLKKILYYYKAHHYNLEGVKSHTIIEALRP